MDITEALSKLLLSMPLLILSLSVHEAAHAITALYYGDTTARDLGRVTLNPLAHIDLIGTIIIPVFAVFSFGFALIGWAKPVPVNPLNLRNYRRDHSMVALAGPVSNILLSFVFLIGFIVISLVELNNTGVYEFLYKLMYYGIYVNIALAVFNMLPIPPLDGSHVLSYFLPPHLAESYSRLGVYGFIILLVLINIPFFSSFMGWVINAVARPYFLIAASFS